MGDRQAEPADVPSDTGGAPPSGHDVLPIFFMPPAPGATGDGTWHEPNVVRQPPPAPVAPARPVEDPLDVAPLPIRRWEGPQPHRPWRPRPRVSRRRGIVLAVIGLIAVIAGAAIAVVTWTTRGLEQSVDRVPDVFPTGQRPAQATGLTFLLVGKDPTSVTARGVVDSLMLLHVDGNRTKSQVIYLPVYAQVKAGGATLDDDYGRGGPQQLVRSVETLTKVRVDHYAEVDFLGFKTVTDALDGVDVDVPAAYTSGAYRFPAGRQHLDGQAALVYVRDAGRGPADDAAKRQQAMVTALFEQVSRQGMLNDPGTLTSAMQGMARAFKVDDTLDTAGLVQLVWTLRGLSPPEFVTAPVSDTAVQGDQLVATFDPVRGKALWGYLRHGTLARHLAEFR